MPIVSTAKMTARQFQELGEDPAGVRLELVNGEVAVSPSPTPEHAHILIKLVRILDEHVSDRLGVLLHDVDTIFGEYDVRRPDVLFFTRKRAHLVERKRLKGPPDLAVEIISPSSSTIDRVDKYEQYEAGGVLHYWVIDPEVRTIEGFSLRRGKYRPVGRGQGTDLIALPPFPKLSIPLGRLWLPDFKNGKNGRKHRR